MKKIGLKRNSFVKIIALMLILIMLISICGCGLINISRENYNKISTGMSFSDVVDILGSDYEVSSDAGYGGYNASCYVWESWGKCITIIFLNGRVYSKAQSGL